MPLSAATGNSYYLSIFLKHGTSSVKYASVWIKTWKIQITGHKHQCQKCRQEKINFTILVMYKEWGELNDKLWQRWDRTRDASQVEITDSSFWNDQGCAEWVGLKRAPECCIHPWQIIWDNTTNNWIIFCMLVGFTDPTTVIFSLEHCIFVCVLVFWILFFF